MPDIYLYTSNRLEKLSESAAEVVRAKPLSSPFKTEFFMVQTQGMERWLSLQMAKHNGIFSNYRFISPSELLTIIERDVIGIEKQDSPFDRDNYAWAIMHLLQGDIINDDDFQNIRSYIDSNELKLYQLSSKIADIFDQYAIYRPLVLEAWENDNLHYSSSSPHELWQKKLWQALNREHGEDFLNRHRALKDLLGRFNNPGELTASLFPERIIVFGISVLPNYYIDFFNRLSEYTDIHLFLMNPSIHYWGDTKSDRELARINRKLLRGDVDDPDSHYERGNPLLASMGKMGSDFFDSVYSLPMIDVDMPVDDMEGNNKTILRKIQADIYNLQNRNQQEEREMVDDSDRSLKIASCHSPMREVEVLYDHLLDAFNCDSSLRPGDVLVLTTDINEYAPYIAVSYTHLRAHET